MNIRRHDDINKQHWVNVLFAVSVLFSNVSRTPSKLIFNYRSYVFFLLLLLAWIANGMFSQFHCFVFQKVGSYDSKNQSFGISSIFLSPSGLKSQNIQIVLFLFLKSDIYTIYLAIYTNFTNIQFLI